MPGGAFASDAELFALGWEGSRVAGTSCSVPHGMQHPNTLALRLLSMTSGSSLHGHLTPQHPHTELWGCQSHPAPLLLAEACPSPDSNSESRPSVAQLPRALQGSDSFTPALLMKTSFFLKSGSMSEPREASAGLLESFGELPGLPRAVSDSTQQQQTCPGCLAEVAGDTAPDPLHPLLLREPLTPQHLSCWRESGHVRPKHPVGGGKVPFCFHQTVRLRERSNNQAGTRLFARERRDRAGRGHGKHRNTDGWSR